MGRRLSGRRLAMVLEGARQHGAAAAQLREQGRHREGLVWQLHEVAGYRILAEADPGILEVVALKLVDRGLWLFQLERYEETLSGLEEAASICRRPEAEARPDVLLDALNSQWRTLVMMGRYEQALAACQAAVAVCVGDEQFGLRSKGRRARAVAQARGPGRGWAALRRDQGIACCELGFLLRVQGHAAWAEAAFRGGEQCGHGKAASDLGDLLGARGDLSAAEAAYKRAARSPEAGAEAQTALRELRAGVRDFKPYLDGSLGS